MKKYKYKIIGIFFIIFILITGLGTAVLGARDIYGSMLYNFTIVESDKAMDKINAIIDGCEKGMNKEYILKNNCVNIFGAFQNLLNKKTVEDSNSANGVIKLSNGYLTFYKYKEADINTVYNNTIELKKFLDSRNIPLLYIQSPNKISKYDNKLPEGIRDYSNKSADAFLSKISQSDIDTLDLREEIKKDGVDHYDMFFRTDHHWTSKSGIWAFEKIAKKLNGKYDFNIDEEIWNIENYDIKTYKNSFLGSLGKRVGLYYTNVDDIDVITPKFDTKFEAIIEGEHKKGEYKDILLDFKYLSTNDYFNEFPYNVFTGGDRSLMNIKNMKNTKGKKILLIKDSFANAVVPYLSLSCSELDVIDLRINGRPELKDYINKSNPDLIIMMYCPDSVYEEETLFNFD